MSGCIQQTRRNNNNKQRAVLARLKSVERKAVCAMELASQQAARDPRAGTPCSNEPSRSFASAYHEPITLSAASLSFKEAHAEALEKTCRAVMTARTLIRLHTAALTAVCVLLVRAAAEFISSKINDGPADEVLARRLAPLWAATGGALLLALATSPQLVPLAPIVRATSNFLSPLLAAVIAIGGACLSLAHGELQVT